jgi:hypothetical protein
VRVKLTSLSGEWCTDDQSQTVETLADVNTSMHSVLGHQRKLTLFVDTFTGECGGQLRDDLPRGRQAARYDSTVHTDRLC